MLPDLTKKDFFLSYNKADREWAVWIAWELEAAGYSVIIQDWDFVGGSNFILEMNRATKESDRTIVVLSDNYLSSGFTQPEWAEAFRQDPKGDKHKILPFRVQECSPEGLLGPLVYVDFLGQDETSCRALLLGQAAGDRLKPTKAPAFPGSTQSSKPHFPGTLASPAKPGQVWHVPYHRNPHFSGRRELLDQLREKIKASGGVAVTQALSGLGGIGKTQIAIEYCYRHRDEYDLVWWLRSENAGELATDFVGLAESLGLSEPSAGEQSAAIELAKQWLEDNSGWLLIFDNAPNQSAVLDLLPTGTRGHTIITSQDQNWSGLAEMMDIPLMGEDEAADFLLTRTQSADHDGARELANELGYLPLALEQAAAYMLRGGRSIADYLRLYKKRAADLLQKDIPSTGYDKTVWTTWALSIEEVRSECPAAVDLLRLFSYLAPDDIPLDLIIEASDELPKRLAVTVNSEVSLDNALSPLTRFSLVTVSDGLCQVHRLVQMVTREQMSMRDQRKWIESAVRSVNRSFPYDSDDVRTWRKCALLLSHALTVSDFGESENETVRTLTTRLLSQSALYLDSVAQSELARDCVERALKIDEAVHGSESPEVADDLNNLGSVLYNLRDLALAREHLERALRISEKVHGPEDHVVAIRLNNLGSVLREQGDLQKARDVLERALRIDQATLDPTSPSIAIRLNNLANVLDDLGDFIGAKELWEQALKIDEAIYGDEHPVIGNRLNNLSFAFLHLGDVNGARDRCERALHIFESSLGPDHRDTIKTRRNLAEIERELRG